MKHSLKITLVLLFLFIAAHVVGLFVTKHYLPETSSLPFNIQRPEMDQQTSYVPIFITILFATALALLLIKFQAFRLWKVWFFLSVAFCLTISFNAFIPELFALALGFILAIFKVFKPNIYIHNITEVFIYGALSAMFVPVLNIFSVSILLILISIYDMIAVWKTKHMISMAKFQSSAKMFTGLLIPYRISQRATPQFCEETYSLLEVQKTRSSSMHSKKMSITKNIHNKNLKQIHVEMREAILGGGDIGFPLLFSGVVLKLYGFIPALIISAGAALALLVLFLIAKKKKFYPAMPFVTVGCFVGFLIVRIFY